MLICATFPPKFFFLNTIYNQAQLLPKFLFRAPYLLTYFICSDQLPFSPPSSNNVVQLSFALLRPCGRTLLDGKNLVGQRL